MRKNLFLILIICCYSFHARSQNTIDWKNYLPQQAIDSIVILSTAGTEAPSLTKQDSVTLTAEQLRQLAIQRNKIRAAFYDTIFPVNNYTTYLDVYDNKRYISTFHEISAFIKLFPYNHCTSVSGDRCPHVLRDCVLFFYRHKLIYALKLCLTCHYSFSTPYSHEARCLADPEHINAIAREWVRRGLINLEK